MSFLRLLPLDEIERLEALQGSEMNEAKKVSLRRLQPYAMAGRQPKPSVRLHGAHSRKVRRPPGCRRSRSVPTNYKRVQGWSTSSSAPDLRHRRATRAG
jgi:hypothetical protein